MAPLFSKVDSNKLLHDVQNEETVIYAKFGNDLFNISKVRGRKTKWPRFFGLPGILYLCSGLFNYLFKFSVMGGDPVRLTCAGKPE